jgi:hypothetical protein
MGYIVSIVKISGRLQAAIAAGGILDLIGMRSDTAGLPKNVTFAADSVCLYAAPALRGAHE